MDQKRLLKTLNSFSSTTLMVTLGIEYVEAGADFLVATMPVNERVHQPMGLLHGGASVALAESVASAASMMLIDPGTQEVRGVEISANHVGSVRSGTVTARANLVHKGRTTHLWQVRIEDQDGKLISVCKMTSLILTKK